MENSSENDVLNYNQQGLIPGPDESEEDFLKRAAYCLNLKNSFNEVLQKEIPGDLDTTLSSKVTLEAAPITKQLFGITPTWIPIIFSNFRMLPWHGGSAWIFQLKEDSPTSAFFQLRKTFANAQTYLGIYDRKELIAHETAHVGRMLFNEPKFEELLAYRTSSSWFRRWFGPIVQSSWESLLFVFILLLCFLSDLAVILSGYPDPLNSTMWIKLIPVLFIVLGIARVSLRHWQFDRCLSQLQQILGKDKANAVIYRLTDREILMFGKMQPTDISNFVKEAAQDSLRWKVIQTAYFSS